MNTKEIIKEAIIDTGRTTYNYTFDVLNAVQEQGEKTLNAVLERATWIDGENRKAVDTWIAAVKTGQNNARTVLDQNFNTFERLLGGL